MLKKLTLSATLFSLTACNSPLLPNNQVAYKVSDEEVNRYILIGNAIEQCLYPEIKLANNDKEKLEKIYRSWSPAVHNAIPHETFWSSFPSDIAYIISKDQASQEYFKQSYKRLNHSKPTEPPYELNRNTCNEFKKSFATKLKEFEKVLKDNPNK